MTRDDGRRSSRAGARGAAAVGAALLVALLAATAWAVWPPWMRQEGPEPVYPDVTASVDDVRSRMGQHDVILIDARSAADYAAGHIPGAVSMSPPENLTNHGLSIGDIPTSLGAAGLSGSARYICYGEGADSDAAAFVFWLLEAGGAERVQVLDGGYDAWLEAGGRVEVAQRRGSGAVWTRAPVDSLLAPLGFVQEHYGVRGYEIIDARRHELWEGDPTDDRSGHVPHSLAFDFGSFIEDGRLLPPEECREVFGMTGPRPSNPVRLTDLFIVHGEGGADGAMGYYLLRRAGVARVRYYPGGWRRWKADDSLPVVRFISGEELKDLVEGENRWPWQNSPPSSFVLFDVRHEGDHARGHIPGSICLTSRLFADSLDVYLDRHWPGVDRATTPIVTYCYGPSCIRSRHTSTDAARAGFLRVWRFYGGLEEWRAVDGRIAK